MPNWHESFVAVFCSENYWTSHIKTFVHPKTLQEWRTGSVKERRNSDHSLWYCIVLCFIRVWYFHLHKQDWYYFVILYLYKWSLREKHFSVTFTFANLVICWCKKVFKLHSLKKKIFNLNILNDFFFYCVPWNLYTSKDFIKKRDPLGHWKNGWIQTPQWILMDPV